MPGYGERKRKKQKMARWGDDHELWCMDVRRLDMGLVCDKLERAVREAITKHLLMDMRGKRLVVILPSLMPHPLLNAVLGTLFSSFQNPGITLLSPPVLSTMVAGLRSGLVVDIGWTETIVTGICEYREVHEKRTTRAMRMVTLGMARLLQREDTKQMGGAEKSADTVEEELIEGILGVDLEQAEEVTTRMAWCRSRQKPVSFSSTSQDLSARLVSIAEDEGENPADSSDLEEDTPISVPSPSSSRLSIQLPFSAFSSPVETALIGNSTQTHLDDDEQPVHKLMYKSLLSLPPDVRSVCMSRIIFTGGGSKIPGLKARLLDEVVALVEARGWDQVDGKAADERRRRLREVSGNRRVIKAKEVVTKNTSTSMDEQSSETNTSIPASQAPQIADPIEEKIHRKQNKGAKPTLSGVIRGVESLGAWAGASLLASLRIKGVVEIERDAFLQHGLAGARRDAEANPTAVQKGMPRPGASWQSGWTLGPWA